MKSTMIAIGLAVLGFSLAGCGSNSTEGTKAADGPLEAQVIYKQNCLSCHGGDLEGRVGPSLLAIGEKYEPDQLRDIIMNGQGGMPAFKKRLNEEEVAVLAEWLADYSR